MNKMYAQESEKLWIVTPFERPDVCLAVAAANAGAFPILHLGGQKTAAQSALDTIAKKLDHFGVCLTPGLDWTEPLPKAVRRILLPWGMTPPQNDGAALHWQVHSAAEARAALAAGERRLVLKGAEGAGLCGEESNWILFQQLRGVCQQAEAALLIQGGVGVHSSAAYFALGAAGVLLDTQIALFPECGLPKQQKAALLRLTGTEIKSQNGYRYFLPPGAASPADETALLAGVSAAGPDLLPMGQDAVIAQDLAEEYKRLKRLVRAINHACAAHLNQAFIVDAFAENGVAAMDLGTALPVIQGPMARISDTPALLRAVADGGALPFLAMGLAEGKAAEEALSNAARALDGKPFGVGLLGFAYPRVVAEQTKLIVAAKPPFVLIAGGHPAQAKPFEHAGISVLFHAPTPGLLDLFLKEQARSFVFEGRESGGHVGPFFSTVLWEKQINRMLKSEGLSDYRLCFAGGIHDAVSAAFVRVMVSPLSARGAKIYLQCGTAYLYTAEAVASGAITPTYQHQLTEGGETILLQSGAGQGTRCVKSPYTDFFGAEKARMAAEGVGGGEALLRLEQLNLGRLRIAAKGVSSGGGALAPLTKEEQLEQGLYMTGAVTALCGSVTDIAALHHALITDSFSMLKKAEPKRVQTTAPAASDIAVIGMAGIFPGAADLDDYWRNILLGRDCITEVPPERWSADLFYSPDAGNTDRTVSKWGGFIGKSDFDALEFGITPQSLAAIEPIQILSLLVAKRALEDAGFTDLSKAELSDTAVIFGAEGAGELTTAYGSRAGLHQLLGELPKEATETLPRLTEDSFPGVLSNVITGRISNRLNTGGRNFTVNAACASSLAALDIAVSELTSNRANMVILGGADLHNGAFDYLLFSSTYALSPKGRCASFDTEADGITLGEGIGAVILKRLADAERDKDNIYAVIKGVGGSSDGKSLGLTAPNKTGQLRALEQAYETAGVRPAEVGLIEAHGTGTTVGDKIELSALTDLFLADGTPPGRVALSAGKSYIGHTKCAAGIAGLIKSVYCVRHGCLPPTQHLNQPNTAYTKNSPFAFRTEKAGFWREERRVAGISGFGFGGTNFHTIITNYPNTPRPETTLRAWPAELYVFSGATKEAAFAQMDQVAALLAANDSLRPRDVAYSLATRAGKGPIQYAIVAESLAKLAERMAAAQSGKTDESIYALAALPGKMAFLFPGQGSQRPYMAAELFLAFPAIRRLLEAYPDYERILFPPSVFSAKEKADQRAQLTDTRNAQPILGIVDMAIATLLRTLGIEPDVAAGHSYGELAALCYAGAVREDDLVPLSIARAEAILAAVPEDPGKMTAVFVDAATLNALLADETAVWPVNYNTPRQTVLAGASADMARFEEKLDEAGVVYKSLTVACAFHSPLLKGADARFQTAMTQGDYCFSPPQIDVFANTDAERYPETPEGIRQRLAAHLVQPVRFTDTILRMAEAGVSVFIEAGSGGAMTNLAAETLKDRPIALIRPDQTGADGLAGFLRVLAAYLATGRSIRYEALYAGRGAVLLDLDHPETVRKGRTVWQVDGKSAVPVSGELPAHAGKPFSGQALFAERLKKIDGGDTDQIMLTYLQNMNAMIEDQRDVMLGFLGAEAPRAGTARRAIAPAALPETPPEEETVPAMVIEDAEAEAAPLPAIESLSTEAITKMVFEIVSEKTGYPIEMLHVDMDLESDLSIDSIKKMEIVGGLGDRVQLPEGGESNMEYFFEKIISIKRFSDLTEWIEEIGKAAAEGTLDFGDRESFVGARVIADLDLGAQTMNQQLPIVRMTLKETAYPLGETDLESVRGKTFAITEDGGGLAVRAAEVLTALGALPLLFSDWQEAEGLSDCDGVILINAYHGRRYTPVDLFHILKRADWERLQTVLVLDDFRGGCLRDAEKISTVPQGFPGLMKSLAHEYPKTRCQIAQFETPFTPETVAQAVTNELTAAAYFPEVFYRDGERFQLLPTIRPVTVAEDETPLLAGLGPDAVVVVLGGAQGITAHIVRTLAETLPCRYILIGRSEETEESTSYASFETLNDIRRDLIENQGMKNPKEIEAKAKQLFKSSRITPAMARIRAVGGRVSYLCADVTDDAAFEAALAAIQKEYGKIDAVIHAAGILEDRLLREKQADSFSRVYDTKAKPLATVLRRLLPDLKLLVLFGSMAAAFGNAGQTDYAAGNSVFDIAAWVLKRQYPTLRTVAFNWGPWVGAGMVGESMKNAFMRKGISFIPLVEGSRFLADELRFGEDATVLAITCDEMAVSGFIDTLFGGGDDDGTGE